jgi:hypothetical protein
MDGEPGVGHFGKTLDRKSMFVIEKVQNRDHTCPIALSSSYPLIVAADTECNHDQENSTYLLKESRTCLTEQFSGFHESQRHRQ